MAADKYLKLRRIPIYFGLRDCFQKFMHNSLHEEAISLNTSFVSPLF